VPTTESNTEVAQPTQKGDDEEEEEDDDEEDVSKYKLDSEEEVGSAVLYV